MPERMEIRINGRPVSVPRDSTVAAAIAVAGLASSRQSATKESRGPLCGMGVCFECRVTIDGVPHRLGCQTPCSAGMEVTTDAG